MTDDTKTALEEAIQAHFAAEYEGAMVTGYVIQMFGSTADDIEEASIRTLREVPETQNIVTTLGLVRFAARTVESQLFNPEWEEGDDS